MATSLDDLDEFLLRARQRRWCWKRTNCALWVADWIEERSGYDPAADLRGRADNPDQWRDLLQRLGGFMPLIGEAMDRCGFARTQSPQRGDVAVISVPFAMCDRMPVVGAVCGICCSCALPGTWPLFVARSMRGLHFERFAMVTGWRIA